jgi:hypothetical protein
LPANDCDAREPTSGAPITDLAGNALNSGVIATFNVNSGSAPPTLLPGPVILGTQVVMKNGALSQIIVSYSAAMDAAAVAALADYTLIDAGTDPIFGNKNDKTIRIAKAAYNAASHSVTLTLKKTVSLKDSIRLTVNAQGPGGVHDLGGRFLNSPSGSATGKNAVVSLGKPAKAAKPKPGKPHDVVLVRETNLARH